MAIRAAVPVLVLILVTILVLVLVLVMVLMMMVAMVVVEAVWRCTRRKVHGSGTGVGIWLIKDGMVHQLR